MSSWGAGRSTSDAEASAKAAAGIDTAALPVSYTLPPDLLSSWAASSNRPGLALVGSDLRPELMMNNVRASIFPHLQQQVQSSLALSMGRQAWSEVERLERTHAWKCGKTRPTLKFVEPVDEPGQEPRRADSAAAMQRIREAASSAAGATGNTLLPPVTRTESFFGRWWSGNLFAPRSSAAAASSEQELEQSRPSNPPEGQTTFVSRSSALAPRRFLASERWLIQRCDGSVTYRVQYFAQGDLFYAQVAPTDFKGLITMGYVAAKEAIRAP